MGQGKTMGSLITKGAAVLRPYIEYGLVRIMVVEGLFVGEFAL